jgi:hypothetical protein
MDSEKRSTRAVAAGPDWNDAEPVTGVSGPLARAVAPADATAQCLVMGTLATSAALWPWVRAASAG